MDQRDLVERAGRGDHDAFALLLGASIARLEAVARLILRDQEVARDAVQDAYIRAWRDLPGLRDPDQLDAWMHRLTVNACLDVVRRRRRRPIEVDLSPIDGACCQRPDRAHRRPRSARARLPPSGSGSARRYSCSTTTWACPPQRWPKRSASRWAQPSRVSRGPSPRFGRRSGHKSQPERTGLRGHVGMSTDGPSRARLDLLVRGNRRAANT